MSVCFRSLVAVIDHETKWGARFGQSVFGVCLVARIEDLSVHRKWHAADTLKIKQRGCVCVLKKRRSPPRSQNSFTSRKIDSCDIKGVKRYMICNYKYSSYSNHSWLLWEAAWNPGLLKLKPIRRDLWNRSRPMNLITIRSKSLNINAKLQYRDSYSWICPQQTRTMSRPPLRCLTLTC